jgi:hypothetical protein
MEPLRTHTETLVYVAVVRAWSLTEANKRISSAHKNCHVQWGKWAVLYCITYYRIFYITELLFIPLILSFKLSVI